MLFSMTPAAIYLTMCMQIFCHTTIKHLLIQSYLSGEERMFQNQDVQEKVI